MASYPIQSQQPTCGTSTAQYATFIGCPMGNRPVTAVPGIGPVIGRRLIAAGIHTAKQLYGYYLIDPAGFPVYMQQYGANRRYQAFAFNAFSGWDVQHN